MNGTMRTFAIAAGAVAVLSLGGVAYGAPPPAVGSSCGPNKVITDIHTCADVNSSCTGYDMMIIGRVDHWGHCVIPGVNGTTW